ncbi:glycosyltransferase [Klebsiella quasipneumoniae]|uniref:glycosyltransferase n=1 Tax=Klebsiella pneumoniae complex TaxID=3390273 RepID=UPI001CD37DE9|nr:MULTISPECIES: glycosyltransferase [Klebsiella]MCH2027891.1 glycosyltransferase [Klebsiella quasipneumoniae]MCJ4958719.1 glycosyltransferase [Klebsiella pneumoniae]MCQ0704426.1 glycosyltransferase [Klebsiella pneumoniae]MCQ3866448.1 glycosyltransferase [Klebsiella quasipneumoniae]MDD1874399.1 glycosyltransferase [Klebsiella pneumoniae]
MRNKILFATHNSEDDTDGVWKKIKSQVSAFRELGASVDFFYTKDKKIILDDGLTKKIIPCNIKYKYLYYIFLMKYIEKENKHYDLAYIRKPHGGIFVIFLPFLLKKLQYKNTYIVIEIPTYPYEKETASIRIKILNVIFDMTLPFFRNKINEISYMGDEVERIWNVKATRISNGVDIQSLSLIDEKKNVSSDFIIVGVANLEFWHGYDRVIEGINRYGGNENVVFHIVGYSQPEISRIKNLVLKYNIEDKVIFHGKKSGEELELVLKNADVCVDALGRHRSGNNSNSSIKSKEYTARGLPFIKSHIDYAFGQEEFILQIPADDSPINIDSIIKWRKNLPNGFSIKERMFALEKLTWSEQLKFFVEDK